jgi:DNA polymerase V
MIKKGGKRIGAGRPEGKGPYGEKTHPIRVPISLLPGVKQFIAYKGYQLPFYLSKVKAGFPSPADDYIDDYLDLNEHLIQHPAATFFVRASGNSMINAGIHDNDILIVDRSLLATDGKIVIAAVAGELTVKRFKKTDEGGLMLLPENPEFPPIIVRAEEDVQIWGVVTSVIHKV